MLSRMKRILVFLYLYLFRARKNVCVPMADGTMLRVNVILPMGRGPWPAVITAIPYQKDGMGAGNVVLEGLQFLEAGYVYVLADLRGHGASGGISQDPLQSLRADDLRALVAWCTGSDWCNGQVGMEGESYGGVTALCAAASGIPGLNAIFVNMAPFSFYRSLVSHGGARTMMGLYGAWLTYMNVTNLLPPLRIRNLPDWREIWEKRLEAYVPYAISPSDHPEYDAYWQERDIKVENISVPTYILDGWRGFSARDAIEIFRRVKGPKKITIGPWVHNFPSVSSVEPIDYIHECVRWFDYWLKHDDNGIMDEPPVAVYSLGSDSWRFENELPAERVTHTRLHLSRQGALKEEEDSEPGTIEYAHDPGVGTRAGLVMIFPHDRGYPLEQDADNARSLVFDTDPLAQDVVTVGEPTVTVSLSTDMPDAMISAKLCDVSADGRSFLITSGVMRLSRMPGNEETLLPGTAYTAVIRLQPIDYHIRRGHRLRLSLALSDFPRFFPLPYRGTVSLFFGPGHEQCLEFDALAKVESGEPAPSFRRPDPALAERLSRICTEEHEISGDEKTGETCVHWGVTYMYPLLHLKGPLKISLSSDARISGGDPETARVESEGRGECLLAGKRYTFIARQVANLEEVRIEATIREDGRTVYERSFQKAQIIYGSTNNPNG